MTSLTLAGVPLLQSPIVPDGRVVAVAGLHPDHPGQTHPVFVVGVRPRSASIPGGAR